MPPAKWARSKRTKPRSRGGWRGRGQQQQQEGDGPRRVVVSVLEAAYPGPAAAAAPGGTISTAEQLTGCRSLQGFLCLFPARILGGSRPPEQRATSLLPLAHLLRPRDPPAYRDLLARTQVAFTPTPFSTGSGGGSSNAQPAMPVIRIPDPAILQQQHQSGASQDGVETRFTHTEILHRAIGSLLRLQSGVGARDMPNNLLTYGFQRLNGRNEGSGIMGTHGVENYFPNTLLNALKTPAWQLLLSRIGDSAMTFLLLHTSIFLELPNHNYFQVTGIPITDIPNFARAVMVPERQRVTMATAVPSAPLEQGNNPNMDPERRAPARSARSASTPTPLVLVTLERSRIFYARAVHCKGGKVWAGLPPSHALQGAWTLRSGEEHTTQATDACPVNLLLHIFPGQFKQPLAYTPVPKGSWKKQQHPQEQHGARAPRRPSKGVNEPRAQRRLDARMRRVLPLIAAVQRRHRHCHYAALLDHHCPASNTMLLGERDALAPFQLSYWQVRSFARAVLRHLLPCALVGGGENMALLLERADEFVGLRRYETMTLHHVLEGFKTSHFSWLGPEDGGQVCPTASRKQREVVAELLFWVFDGILIPLLKNNFYVTDTVSDRNRIAYFRHATWQSITAALAVSMKATLLSAPLTGVAAVEAQATSLGCSYIRWLPKEVGARPITNLRRRLPPPGKRGPAGAAAAPGAGAGTTSIFTIARAPTTGAGALPSASTRANISINTMLSNAFQVLAYERRRDPAILGASVMGLGDIYARLKQFQQSVLHQHGGELPPLHFCKVDIKGCFDTIHQETLVEVLGRILSCDEYILQRHTATYPSGGRLKKEYVRRAKDAEEFCEFAHVAAQLASTHRRTVFVDQVVHTFEERDGILELLRRHVLNNLLSVDNQLYRQITGIPQGSVLSTLLCSFFYAHMEERELAFVRAAPDTLLMRYVDDFLLVTAHLPTATRFLACMEAGFPAYGCAVHPDKTLITFPWPLARGAAGPGPDRSRQLPPGTQAFPWCGLHIDVRTLAVQSDYSRHFTACIASSLTRDPRAPGASLAGKLANSLRSKAHAIFLDVGLNGWDVVLGNVYQHLLVTAAKFYAYLKGRAFRKHNPAFQLGIIHQTLEFAHHLMHSRTRSALAVEHACTFRLAQGPVSWLGVRAFHAVLSRKQADYRPLLERLEGAARELQDGLQLDMRKRLYAVVQREEQGGDAGECERAPLLKRLRF